MLWIDRIEKVGRLLLWLTLASAVVLVPITYIKQAQVAEAARKEEQAFARKASEAAAKAAEDKKPVRLTLASMGAIIRSLDTSRAKGAVWFSNVSARAGFVCVMGVMTNQTTKASTESLPACKSVDAYASTVDIPLMFANGDVDATCRGGTCELSLKEAPESK